MDRICINREKNMNFIKWKEGDLLNNFRSDFIEVKEKIQKSSLPDRYKHKLICDLEYISNVEEVQLSALILFGSCARGDIKSTSDIDLLIVSETELERDTRADIRSELAEDMDGVTTDVVFYKNETFNSSDHLFTLNVKKDGKILWRSKHAQ